MQRRKVITQAMETRTFFWNILKLLQIEWLLLVNHIGVVLDVLSPLLVVILTDFLSLLTYLSQATLLNSLLISHFFIFLRVIGALKRALGSGIFLEQSKIIV